MLQIWYKTETKKPKHNPNSGSIKTISGSTIKWWFLIFRFSQQNNMQKPKVNNIKIGEHGALVIVPGQLPSSIVMPGFQLLIYLQNDPHSFFPSNSLSFLCFFSLRSLPYPVRLSSPQKNEDPLPAFTCPLFFPSSKSFPVPTINQSPSLTTTMARW